MELTRFGHSCVRLERDGRALVIDPGTFADAAGALAAGPVHGVLVTHEHPDHLDHDVVVPWLAEHPEVPFHAPGVVVDDVRSRLSGRSGLHTAEAGQRLDVAGFEVHTVGGQHAVIHPLIPYVANLGYVVDGSVYHPGDALVVPPVEVDTLLVPLHAPWSKSAEVIDFVIAVRPRRAIPIHDGLLNDRGRELVLGHAARLSAPFEVELVDPVPGEPLRLPPRRRAHASGTFEP
ncbi:MBL fold metallo-hydrolase [Zhihengliuella sp.]|uniref:MBL fold metallo-hydrolase n=1 Tax=Zhihengliuella sp. TaxID=1954483 RepID=UPI002811AA71|nr:MBL fold metallo-hydrolase [Zhihengliuella sp.]